MRRSYIHPGWRRGAYALRQHRISQIRHAHPIFGFKPMRLVTGIQILPKAFNLIAEPLPRAKDLARMELRDLDACLLAPIGNHILCNQHSVLNRR